MSLHDFDSRAGLETMFLHFGHDSFSSYSSPATAFDGYIVVPKPDRVPFSDKSHNIPHRRVPIIPAKSGSGIVRDASLVVPNTRPCTPVRHDLHATRNESPMACQSFQPLPPVLVNSPLRLPSFLDLTLQSFQSLDYEPSAPSHKPESPSPRAIPRQLAIDIPSVLHPNSPYVPWASPVRRNILRPLTPASHVSVFSTYSRPYSRSGARAPEPQDPDSPPPAQNKFIRLSKSIKNLRRTVKQGVKHVKHALTKTHKAKSPEPVDPPIRCPLPVPPLPSPVSSRESSNTDTLAEWLQQCEMKVERAKPRFMTFQEYEERGSWLDLTKGREESETRSWLVSEPGVDDEQVLFPGPMSPTSPNSDSFPQLMHNIWPTPPSFLTPVRGFSATREREMSMPGGWDSPAAYV